MHMDITTELHRHATATGSIEWARHVANLGPDGMTWPEILLWAVVLDAHGVPLEVPQHLA